MLIKLLCILTMLILKPERYEEEYIIQLEQPLLNIYWISENNILLSYINSSEILNLENRSRYKLGNCTNCVYGYDREIVRCEYSHREIHSMNEYSTTVSIFDESNNLLYTKDIFETVTPVICMKEYILLINAYSFLEEKNYLLNTETGNINILNRIQEKDVFKNGNRKIYLKDSLIKIYEVTN